MVDFKKILIAFTFVGLASTMTVPVHGAAGAVATRHRWTAGQLLTGAVCLALGFAFYKVYTSIHGAREKRRLDMVRIEKEKQDRQQREAAEEKHRSDTAARIEQEKQVRQQREKAELDQLRNGTSEFKGIVDKATGYRDAILATDRWADEDMGKQDNDQKEFTKGNYTKLVSLYDGYTQMLAQQECAGHVGVEICVEQELSKIEIARKVGNCLRERSERMKAETPLRNELRQLFDVLEHGRSLNVRETLNTVRTILEQLKKLDGDFVDSPYARATQRYQILVKQCDDVNEQQQQQVVQAAGSLPSSGVVSAVPSVSHG